jgi:hypothetical protein
LDSLHARSERQHGNRKEERREMNLPFQWKKFAPDADA